MTNDVDLGVQPEIVQVSATSGALVAAGYKQDELGYPFRYTRMTPECAQIVDLLVDSTKEAQGALGVEGLAAATAQTTGFDIAIATVGVAPVRVPTLDGAFLLRALALVDGPSHLKFDDYAKDAAVIGELLLGASEDLARWRRRDASQVRAARDAVLPLFASSTAPGSVAVSTGATGDSALVARRASSAIRTLFD